MVPGPPRSAIPLREREWLFSIKTNVLFCGMRRKGGEIFPWGLTNVNNVLKWQKSRLFCCPCMDNKRAGSFAILTHCSHLSSPREIFPLPFAAFHKKGHWFLLKITIPFPAKEWHSGEAPEPYISWPCLSLHITMLLNGRHCRGCPAPPPGTSGIGIKERTRRFQNTRSFFHL